MFEAQLFRHSWAKMDFSQFKYSANCAEEARVLFWLNWSSNYATINYLSGDAKLHTMHMQIGSSVAKERDLFSSTKRVNWNENLCTKHSGALCELFYIKKQKKNLQTILISLRDPFSCSLNPK